MKEILAQRKQSERQERINRVLSAAGELFLKKGYTNTTMRDICRKAALSTGAVYFYFKSKDAIYAQICENIFGFLESRFKKELSGEKEPEKRLRAMAGSYLDFYISFKDQWEIIKGFRTVGLPEEILQNLLLIDMQLFGLLRGIVDEFLRERHRYTRHNSEEVAVALWGSVEGLLAIHNMGFFKSTSLDLKQMVSSQIDIFLAGLT